MKRRASPVRLGNPRDTTARFLGSRRMAWGMTYPEFHGFLGFEKYTLNLLGLRHRPNLGNHDATMHVARMESGYGI